MMIAVSGTPGTGKSSVADILLQNGITVIRATETVDPYRLGADPDRDTDIIDDEQWAKEFRPIDGVVEGHLSHLLPADRIIILRCRPDILKKRLQMRGYSTDKVRENVEAELLDVILAEAVDIHGPEKIYEIDTTNDDMISVTRKVLEVITGTAPPASGTVDWLSACGDML